MSRTAWRRLATWGAVASLGVIFAVSMTVGARAGSKFPILRTDAVRWVSYLSTGNTDTTAASFSAPGTAATVETTAVIPTTNWAWRGSNATGGAAAGAINGAKLILTGSAGANADTIFSFVECSFDGGTTWLTNTTAANNLRVSGASSTSFVCVIPLVTDADAGQTANQNDVDLCPWIRVRIRGDANTYIGGATLKLVWLQNPED